MRVRRFGRGVIFVLSSLGTFLSGNMTLCVIGALPEALAQSKGDKPSSASGASGSAADLRARELFASGDAAYAEGRYEEALAAFEEAYALSNRPQLLFNISNALERAGRYAEAASALEKYLASAKAKDRDLIQKRLANLKKREGDQKKDLAHAPKEKEDDGRRPVPEEHTTVEPEVVRLGSAPTWLWQRAPSPAVTPAPPRSDWVPILLFGTGSAALAAAGIFGMLTASARAEAAKECREGSAGTICSSDARAAIDRDKTFSIVTDVALLSGIVTVALGVYALASARRGDAARKASSAQPWHVVGKANQGGVTFAGAF